jgi:cytochrome c556
MFRRTMNRLLVMIALLGAAALAARGLAQDPDEVKDVKKFMRAKLTYSQEALEGLTLENFTAIERNAQQMALLSQDASWNVLETMEYYERSADFRRSVQELQAAARNKNLDGAALAYMGVTLKCIECHRYVRAVQHVDAESR